MSREIKFRAWNKENKIMCYDNEDSSACYWDGAYSSEVGIINRYLNLPEHLRDYEYMQYIGVQIRTEKKSMRAILSKYINSFLTVANMRKRLLYP